MERSGFTKKHVFKNDVCNITKEGENNIFVDKNIRICFCSSIFNMDEYDDLQKKSKRALSIADHKLNSNLIKGIEHHIQKPVDLINNLRVPPYPYYPKIIIKKTLWSHVEGACDINTGHINIPILKHFSKAYTTSRSLKKWIKNNKKHNLVVFVYDGAPYMTIPVLWQKLFHKNIKTVIVVPDIPTSLATFLTSGPLFIKKLYSKFKLFFEKKFDMYVLLTEHMKNKLEIKHQPYVVVEGIYSESCVINSESPKEKKVVFYSGALREAYGLKTLVDAVQKIDNEKYELWICGAGELESYIRDISDNSSKIKFLGFVNPQKIAELQQQATVLVNPRPDNGGVAKYSFPSKTMEYLASGKPVIAYKLPAIPDEYDEYINYIPHDNIQAMKNTILSVCELSEEERKKEGVKNRNFILLNKTPNAQCSKIIKMILDNYT